MIEDGGVYYDEEMQKIFEIGDFEGAVRPNYLPYSQWRIKEVLKEIGFRLQPVYMGYKALRYRPCQRYFIIDEKTNEKVGVSKNGYSFEDLRYCFASCNIPLHGENYKYRRTKDKNGRRYACEEFLQIVNNIDNSNAK